VLTTARRPTDCLGRGRRHGSLQLREGADRRPAVHTRNEIVTSPSGPWWRKVATNVSPSQRRLGPSDCSSNLALNGWPPSTVVRSAAKLGSRCMIRSTPLCTTGATTGLSTEACGPNRHSPEKSDFCCAMADKNSPVAHARPRVTRGKSPRESARSAPFARSPLSRVTQSCQRRRPGEPVLPISRRSPSRSPSLTRPWCA